MTDGLILAVDQGTTNTKAVAIDETGRIVAQASVPMVVDYPKPGWAEQSAVDIWRAVQRVIADVVAQVSQPVDALAISNQRESVVVWDGATGEAIGPVIVWQCRRSAERCAKIRAAGHSEEVIALTGLGIDPLFPAAKIAWLLDSVPDARARAAAGQLKAGTINSWLLWHLTRGEVHGTDHSNASRTQLFNTESLAWDERLSSIFDVPLDIMPKVMRSDSHFGSAATGATALPEGTPVYAMMGDSHAALYGHGVRSPGAVKATYGTGSSLMTLTPGRVASKHGLSGTIAWADRRGVTYALEGNISVSGQAAAFMAETLGLKTTSELSTLAATVSDSNGVIFVPALVGLGAPHWREDARGIICGLSLGTKPAHLARAALEAIAFQVADVYAAMASDLGSPLTGLSVDGGASRNDFLMQLQADLIDQPVRRGDIAELSALGAAAMAATALGRGSDWHRPESVSFQPSMDHRQRAALLSAWQAALHRALS